MLSAQESASALALAHPAGKDGRRSDVLAVLPFAEGDRWTGSYDCTSGKTQLEITFDQLRPGEGPDDVEVDVIVALRSDAGPGRAVMHGNYRAASRRLQLVFQEWLEQLPASRLVDFVGTVQPSGTYTGRVSDHGCTSLTASPAGPRAHHPPTVE
jgi:hypothetical protein